MIRLNDKLSTEEWENIGNLLNGDKASSLVAIEILQGIGCFRDYLTHSYIQFRFGQQQKGWDYQKHLLLRKRIKNLVNYPKSYWLLRSTPELGISPEATEHRILHNIRMLEQTTGIDGKILANYIYKNYQKGVAYLIQEGDLLEQLIQLKKCLVGKTLDLSRLGLSLIPTAIYRFKQTEHLDLSHNRLKTLPRKLLELKKLKTIDISYNKLQKIHPDLLSHPNLERLIVKKANY